MHLNMIYKFIFKVTYIWNNSAQFIYTHVHIYTHKKLLNKIQV